MKNKEIIVKVYSNGYYVGTMPMSVSAIRHAEQSGLTITRA